MPSRSDALTLPVTRLCEIVGVGRQTRNQWVKKGLLRPCARQGCRETDAIQLAALDSVVGVLGFSDAEIAWPQVESDIATRVPGEQLDVIFDVQYKAAVLATGNAEIGQLVRQPEQLIVSTVTTIPASGPPDTSEE